MASIDRNYRQGESGILPPSDYSDMQEEGRLVEESLVRRNAYLEAELARLRPAVSGNLSPAELVRIAFEKFQEVFQLELSALPWDDLSAGARVRERWAEIARAVVEGWRK